MLKPDRFSCSQKIRLKRDPPVECNVPQVYMCMIVINAENKVLINSQEQKIEWRQSFTMTNNMASSGLKKMLYLPILLILTIDGTIGCV